MATDRIGCHFWKEYTRAITLNINTSHRRWFFFSIVILLTSSLAYVLYVRSATNGPTGGSWQGMLFGIVGSAMMVFAGLFNGRKRIPRMRIGSGAFWLKGHIWIGLLSFPMILFHAGFRFGGLLEQTLMIVFAAITLSGVVGLVLQTYVPRVMRESMSTETMYEQVPHLCQRLRKLADQQVEEALGGSLLVTPSQEENDKLALRDFYLRRVRPALAWGPEASTSSQLADASTMFSQVRLLLPPRFYGTVDELKSIWQERYQLARQAKMHQWLHGWLLIHVPLCMTLLVLGIAHIVMSLWLPIR